SLRPGPNRGTLPPEARMSDDAIKPVAVFTQIDTPNRRPGCWWVAELVDGSGHGTVPLAVAYLTDFRDAPHMVEMGMGVVLDFVMVPDHYRRRGFGTRLVEECEARFPGLTLTDSVSEAGEGFLEALEARPD